MQGMYVFGLYIGYCLVLSQVLVFRLKYTVFSILKVRVGLGVCLRDIGTHPGMRICAGSLYTGQW